MEWEEDTELGIADQPGQEVTFHPCPQYTQLGALTGRVGAKGKGCRCWHARGTCSYHLDH